MDSRNQAPQKSSSFSSASSNKAREVDRNLSLGTLRHGDHDRRGAAATWEQIKEECEDEEEDGCGDPGVSELSGEIDAFIAGLDGQAPLSLPEATLENKYVSGAHRVTAVLQRAMAFLEDEFHALLEPKTETCKSIRRPPSFEQGGHEADRCVLRPPDTAPAAAEPKPPYTPETMERLRSIADIMVAAGYVTECTQMLLVARRNAFDASVRALGTLEQVFREHRRNDAVDGEDNNPFAAQLMEVMELLQGNLEGKSRLYKDPALSSIFLMNNGRYMLQKIRGSPETNAMLGETWARKQSTNLRQYHKNYQRETWNRVLTLLRDDGVLTVKGHVQKTLLKERFKQFNSAMDDIQKTQGAWVVSDEQLQSELRVSIAAVVVPAYRSFLGRFAQTFSAGRQAEKYVKLSAEDLEGIIDELFDGNPSSMSRRRT
ncbi:unnamed protein product [Triticum turgidum subsp. durum]|uniref:Exocyst subunit Exo70 family protein n=1 Tax=Triticum turgidum subsp. durum TaxID=4567 RepID=A0A9R0WKS3_TRITD|nr:unnamed protein product [Triticum turgidum subsp. durum]